MEDSVIELSQTIQEELEKVYQASRKLALLDTPAINNILSDVADKAAEQADFILEQNKLDLDRMDPENPKYDRLLLNKERLQGICQDLRNVAKLPSPLGRTLDSRTLDNGLELTKVSVPLGVIGIVFESRPNVTFDVFALCLKSGNASVLKGSRDAHYSNLAIVKVIKEVLTAYQLEDVCYLAPSAREALQPILEAEDYLSIIIPRGGQGLIRFVRDHSKVPVIETGAGIVHTYYDKSADIEKGKRIITNAKARRVSVCNALDTLLIHEDRVGDLPELLEELNTRYACEVFADASAYEQLSGSYRPELLHQASEEDFGTEFLAMKLSVKVVPNMDAAIEHVARYSSKHSEAIIAEEAAVVAHYLNATDSAVVYANASTAFTDGAQFGMGAEIGISTQKLHARGPMALDELTSYKWVARGNGQTRA